MKSEQTNVTLTASEAALLRMLVDDWLTGGHEEAERATAQSALGKLYHAERVLEKRSKRNG